MSGHRRALLEEGREGGGRKRETKGRREGRRVEGGGEETEREGWKMEGGEREGGMEFAGGREVE